MRAKLFCIILFNCLEMFHLKEDNLIEWLYQKLRIPCKSDDLSIHELEFENIRFEFDYSSFADKEEG